MKSQKKFAAEKSARKLPKTATPRPPVEKDTSKLPVLYHREVEQRFIGEHPEAFEPFIGEWVVLEGTSIVAHGKDAGTIADEARARGVKVPYIFRVLSKLKPNEGYLS